MGARWWWWWCAVLAAGGARGGTLLSPVERNLQLQLDDLLAKVNDNYTEPKANATYVSVYYFDKRAMGMLYRMAPQAVDILARRQPYPPGIVTVADGNLEVPLAGLSSKWKPLLKHYAGIAAAVLAALLVAAALPLAGLIWCCYSLVRRKRRPPFDGEYDHVFRGFFAGLLIAFLTLFLFGVVCAFATEAQMIEGVEDSPDTLRRFLFDLRTFLNVTCTQMTTLFNTNLVQLQMKVNSVMESSALRVSLQLGEMSGALSVTRLAGMVRQLGPVRDDLSQVHNLTAALRTRAETLNAGLRTVKKQLLETLARCSQPQCVQLQEKHKIGQLDTEIHYSQVPDVSGLVRNVSAVLDSGLAAELDRGEASFRRLQQDVINMVTDHIPDLQKVVEESAAALKKFLQNFLDANKFVTSKVDELQAVPDALEEAVGAARTLSRLALLGVAAALLGVVAVLVVGLLCGVCGKRHDPYSDGECAGKFAASRCLCCGTMLLFLVGGVASVLLSVALVTGVFAQRFICDPLIEPRGNRLMMDVDRILDLEQAIFHKHTEDRVTVTSAMVRCHANQSLFEVLQLERLLRLALEERRVLGAVAGRAEALTEALQRVHPPALTMLPPTTAAQLTRLAHSGLSEFDFDKILDALDTNMTSLRLDALGLQLEGAAGALRAREGFQAVAGDLRAAAASLRLLHTGLLQPMRADAAELRSTALRLQAALRFNQSSLKEAILFLVHDTTQAQHFLNTQGRRIVHNMTLGFIIDAVEQVVEKFMSRATRLLREDIGRCGPLSRAFNITRDSHCDKILLPINGLWLSLLWCLAVTVPMMAVTVRLGRLYRNCNAYPAPPIEAEYLYDAYADRDNLPLANAYKAEKRGGRGARRGARQEAALPPPVHAHHARRYNDMAPKHWEEGPPRYHGPTEYERPPPYYYPGPNDRQ